MSNGSEKPEWCCAWLTFALASFNRWTIPSWILGDKCYCRETHVNDKSVQVTLDPSRNFSNIRKVGSYINTSIL